ncbi:MAG: tyrosine-type recombinase/integrase [Microthrixaceae bacterium]
MGGVQTDITEKSQMQNRWAAGHIRKALGAIRLDQLDRSDIARWYDELAAGGVLNKRSITIIRRVLRAALEDALDEGLIRRNPAARVPVPKRVVKPQRPKEVDAWDEDQIRTFLTAIDDHRWAGPIRLSTLYGLRRSELLALKWDDIDFDERTVRVDEALIEVEGRPVWTEGKNERSRRTFAIDADTAEHLAAHRRLQDEERDLARDDWDEQNLVLATRTGNRVSPGNFDQTLDRLVRQAGRAAPHLTRPAPHRGDAHGPASHRPRGAASGRRRARTLPRHAHAHLRPRAARLAPSRQRSHRRARGRVVGRPELTYLTRTTARMMDA